MIEPLLLGILALVSGGLFLLTRTWQERAGFGRYHTAAAYNYMLALNVGSLSIFFGSVIAAGLLAAIRNPTVILSDPVISVLLAIILLVPLWNTRCKCCNRLGVMHKVSRCPYCGGRDLK